MEYPGYLARGWNSGGGAVGSAGTTVVGQRRTLAGMRWGEEGADARWHRRALDRSEKGQWDAFRNRHDTQNGSPVPPTNLTLTGQTALSPGK